MSLLIRDAHVVTQDDQRRRLSANVYVEDGTIVSVGNDAPEADHVIKADGNVLIPGLVNTHTHLAMVLLRGYADDLQLKDWLETRIWPAEAALDAKAMAVGARLGLAELVAGGTTTFVDMYFHEPATAAETDAAGVRAILGWGLADEKDAPQSQANPALDRVERFIDEWKDHPLVRGAPAPHAVYTCTDETYAKCADLAKRFKTILHTHAHETRDEVYDVQAKRGKRPLAVLDDAGALNDRTLLAHLGWTTKAEVARLAETGAAASHNPVSNMKLATGGTMPLPEMLSAGVRVGLGTDGAASNNSLDMFESMKTAALLHKHARWDAQMATAQQMLDLATRDGAAAIGLGDVVGSIEPGKRADLALVDVRRAGLSPMHDAVSQLVYAARATDVSLTVVDGRILYRDGAHQTIDEAAAVREAAQVAALISPKNRQA